MDVSPDRGIIALEAGHVGGMALGDLFWILDGSEVVADGVIYLLTDRGAAGRLSAGARPIPGDARVIVLCAAGLADVAKRLPPEATIRGRVVSLPPGRASAWLDIGRRAGLRSEDGILVFRSSRGRRIPIARGQVKELDDDTALVVMDPLVSNTVVEAGDGVELWPWPADRRSGSLSSVIIAVEQGAEGLEVRLVGTQRDGLVVEQLVDLFRGGRYVGTAGITQLSRPLSRARMMESATATRPESGDRAVVRAPLTGGAKPIRAPVFKVEGEVCLLATGEVDGVSVGDKFVVRTAGASRGVPTADIAELTIYTVKVDYCGARIRLLTPDATPVQRWDFAERRLPAWSRPQTVGVIQKAHASGRWAGVRLMNASPLLSAGEVVRCYPAKAGDAETEIRPAAAIVVQVGAAEALISVPRGWGEIEHLEGAAVQVFSP